MGDGLTQLPKGWASAKLIDISEIILGQSPPSSTYNEEKKGLPFYQGKLAFGDIYPSPQKWCSLPKKIAEKGDVLISVRAPIGPTNISPEKSCIGRGLAGIRGLGGIKDFFILYLLRCFEKTIAGQGTGTTFAAISGDQLKFFEVPIPPLSEQHRIVAKIEELFTKLDAGVEALKKVKAQLKHYRQAVLKYAFEGKLTQEWRETNKDKLEPASVLLERIKEERKKKAGGKFKELPPIDTSELPELPAGWEWVRIADLGEVITGTTPSKSISEYYGNDFPFYKPTDLNQAYSVRKSEDGLSKKGIEKARLLPAKSVLVTCIGATIGKTGFIREAGASNQQINAIIPEKEILPEFIYFVCISPQFQDKLITNASSTTLPILNKTKFETLPVPVPPFLEQQKIVEEVEACLLSADEVEKTAEQALKQSERLRQSILKQAFEGKLVPQDPTDEPAEKLLERIKEEKVKREADSNKEKKGKRKNPKQAELI